MREGRVVGALACQRDSYLRKLGTEVVSCVELPPQKAAQSSSGKKAKASKDASAPSQPEAASAPPKWWLVECADSVLFPEGGGQPTDHGTIVPSSRSPPEPIPIKFVQRLGLRCVLHSPQPVAPGTPLSQEVDFRRRWDHMQQHTGQHLLTAIMNTYDNLETLSWGMGADGEASYVELPRTPSQTEIQEIQDKCNETIRANLQIKVETPEDAKVSSLPGDYDKEKGVVRVVKIGGLDTNTCCGTHLSQTSHLSALLLHSTQPIRGTNCRLFFTAGDRAINRATASIGCLRSISRLLSSGPGPEEVLANVTRLNESATELKKKERRLLTEIAEHEGTRVRAELRAGKNAWVHRADEGLEFVNVVLSELQDDIKGGGGVVVVLATGKEQKQGQVVIVGDKDAVERLAAKAKDMVTGIKGGGRGERWQGKVTEWKKGELSSLKTLVESGSFA